MGSQTTMSQAILALLKLSTMTLATVGCDGQAHAAAVYFAADETAFDLIFRGTPAPRHTTENLPSIFFFSDQSSQHSQDLAINPRAAITIYPEVIEWQQIRGLQMRGEVKVIPKGAEWDFGLSLYKDKFPFVSTLLPIVQRNVLYRFTPHWLRWLDNRHRLGFKKEWCLQ
ncbi:MAG: pyridoxamine 5'-phosphate oxidase family protein [Anaerolineales bacterium]